jgi:hypothetical protein
MPRVRLARAMHDLTPSRFRPQYAAGDFNNGPNVPLRANRIAENKET